MPTLAAYAYKKSMGQPFVYPLNKLSYTANFMNMMFSVPAEEYEIDPVIERALNQLLILHADHEQNCSTSTVRIVGSSDANLFASVAAGVLALSGPLHGGANQAVLEMLEEIKAGGGNVEKYVNKAKDKSDNFRLMGFGHRVYKNFDPRCTIIKDVADAVLAKLRIRDELLDIAKKLEEIALKDPYFVEKKLYPNIDFYSGIIYRAMGFPVNMFTVLFTLGRLPGWIAHWKEMRADKDKKIYRPRQIYTGEVRHFYRAGTYEPDGVVSASGCAEGVICKTDYSGHPYFPYVRSDKKDQPRVSIAARLVANLLETAGADRILTMDLHAPQIQGFFNFPCDQLFALKIICDHIKQKPDWRDYVIVAPDVGESKHLSKYTHILNLPLAIVDKRRIGNTDTVEPAHLIGDVRGKKALIVDDEVSTAGTLCKAAKFLKENGAVSVIATAVHPVLTGNAFENIENSVLEELIVTDTIPLNEKKSKITKKLTSVFISLLSVLIVAVFGRIGYAQDTTDDFEDRVLAISYELRCPICQGLSVGESQSTISNNMKDKVRELLREGKSEEEIYAFFEARYGEWILRSPRKKGWNLLVWILPIAVLFGTAGGIGFYLKRRQSALIKAGREPSAQLSEEDEALIADDMKKIRRDL
ncbi:hypothetical protein CHS0354_018351 [Potamilus streckersoni]|uniref:Citrate synthase n=1 Tax=Potamilus streckersoni TaxID=2493646 RepID=A0AAE0TAF5_9BIVA|nr:hypothetical protein CHS0354_018351 [Potamilus streckersoni]